MTHDFDDDEEYYSKTIISGGEVLELNNEHFAPRPVDTHVSGNMPKWMQDYHKLLQAQEKTMTDVILNDVTTIVPTPVIYTNESIALAGLETLREYETQRFFAEQEKKLRTDELLSEEVKKALADLDVEFSDKFRTVDAKIEEIRLTIKKEVLALGHSVKGGYCTAQWRKGAAGGYDTKMLDGMAKIIPAILEAKKKDADPTCAFVPIK